jgi:hypothetical protein
MELAEKSFDKPVIIVTQKAELEKSRRSFSEKKRGTLKKVMRDFGLPTSRKFILDAWLFS